MKSFSRSLLTAMTTDPKVWFLENDHIMVTKTREEGTIPCLVTNPLINVTLYEKDTEVMVEGSYNPIVGFTAALEDRNYKCKGELNGEEKESIGFYVFSIVASKALDTYISASKTVLKQGEMLNVNCTVHGAELVYFSWDFPHKDELNRLLYGHSGAVNKPTLNRAPQCLSPFKVRTQNLHSPGSSTRDSSSAV
ncbi:platelet-derived growth factor receptor beta-like isoform X2 [Puntigrus tetrazona]|uniref:platelet-derived growth factor receptor beta-like isoform X2 n=1 Tax=Puntigrus tetrazona TaxID=1606681 RepID=UPI001C894780|nr:platelet-derived growth factor receptor beta-like isoform X2 [Puntigrus tetrazona]